MPGQVERRPRGANHGWPEQDPGKPGLDVSVSPRRSGALILHFPSLRAQRAAQAREPAVPGS